MLIDIKNIIKNSCLATKYRRREKKIFCWNVFGKNVTPKDYQTYSKHPTIDNFMFHFFETVLFHPQWYNSFVYKMTLRSHCIKFNSIKLCIKNQTCTESIWIDGIGMSKTKYINIRSIFQDSVWKDKNYEKAKLR